MNGAGNVALQSSNLRSRENGAVRKCIMEIKVIDSGIGMSQEAVSRLFQPFSQVHAHGAAKGKDSGAGLGLVIASRFVELMGGRIVVTS